MTRHSILATACVVAMQSVACGDSTENATMGGAGGNASGADSGASMGGVRPRDATGPTALEQSAGLSDAEMVDVVRVISDGEIRQGRLALGKAQNGQVRAFASKMITDHTIVGYSAAVVGNNMGATPSSSEVAGMVTRAGQVAIQAMNATPQSADFDRSYMQLQVDEHRNVLAVLDRMLENADTAAVRTFLTTARTGIARDLDEATRILGTLS